MKNVAKILLVLGPAVVSGTAVLRGSSAAQAHASVAAPASTEASLSTPGQLAHFALDHAKQAVAAKLRFFQVPSVLKHLGVHDNVLSAVADSEEKQAPVAGDEGPDSEDYLSVKISMLIFFLIWVALANVLAKHWNSGARKERYSEPLEGNPTPEEFKEFRHGLCDWHERLDICCWAMFCPAIRWGDNAWTMGWIKSFTTAWFLYLIGTGYPVMIGMPDPTAMSVTLLVVVVIWRQEMRAKFDMPTGGNTLLNDVLTWAFCVPCAIVQEARQVEDAVRAKHPAVVHQADAIIGGEVHEKQ